MKNIMDILLIVKKINYISTLEEFDIYSWTRNDNQINDNGIWLTLTTTTEVDLDHKHDV